MARKRSTAGWVALAASMLIAAVPAAAQTVYKLIDKNGKVTYSEEKPKNFDGKVIRMDIDPNANKADLGAPTTDTGGDAAARTREKVKANDAARAQGRIDKLQAARDKLKAAQDAYAEQLKGAGLVLCLGSMLHSIATGNMLPSWVKIVCVDINPAVATKVSDRGTGQAVGVVTDVGQFLGLLAAMISVAPPPTATA